MIDDKNFVIFIHGLFSTTLLKGSDVVYPIEPVNVIKIYIKNLYENYIKTLVSKKKENKENCSEDTLKICIDKILDKNLKPGVLLDHYNNIIELIKKLCGKNYYIYTYDWRDDLNNIIENFDTELNKLEIENKNITIIGHSAGGLIAYKYINQEKYNNSVNFKKINKLICIGSPIQGSVKALSTIFGLYKEFFLKPEEIKDIINKNIVKSIFQLFPASIHNLFFFNDSKSLLKQEEYKQILYKYGFDDTLLNISIAFRQEMNELEQNKNVDMLFITGIYPKKPMCTSFTVNSDLDNIKCVYDYGAGDGTVLINESAPFISKNFRQRFVVGKHKYLTEYDETLNIIETEITSKEYNNVFITGNIINREKNKDKKILEFMLFLNINNKKYLIKDFTAERITFTNKTYNQDVTKTLYKNKKYNIFCIKTDFKYGTIKIKNGVFTYYTEDKNMINIDEIKTDDVKSEEEKPENTEEHNEKTINVMFKHSYIDLQQLKFYEYLI